MEISLLAVPRKPTSNADLDSGTLKWRVTVVDQNGQVCQTVMTYRRKCYRKHNYSVKKWGSSMPALAHWELKPGHHPGLFSITKLKIGTAGKVKGHNTWIISSHLTPSFLSHVWKPFVWKDHFLPLWPGRGKACLPLQSHMYGIAKGLCILHWVHVILILYINSKEQTFSH